jgi:hypothetical protein
VRASSALASQCTDECSVMLLLDFHKRFYMLVCLPPFRCLFSVNIPAVMDTVALFTSRALCSSLGRPIFVCALSRVLARLIARFYSSRWRSFCNGSVLLIVLGSYTTVSEI